MDLPSEWYADDVVKHGSECRSKVTHPDGREVWVAARPIPYWGLCLRKRISRAWMVFTGKADVLRWHG